MAEKHAAKRMRLFRALNRVCGRLVLGFRSLAPIVWVHLLLFSGAAATLAQQPQPQPQLQPQPQPQPEAALNWGARGTAVPGQIVAPPGAQAVGASISRSSVGQPQGAANVPGAVRPASATQTAGARVTPVSATRRPITRFSSGADVELPNTHGQKWREYDISPYTSKVTNTKKPEQAIVDWILRETGTDAWFSEPLGVLSASGDKLRVYHTPEMHEIVLDVLDRFVGSAAQPKVYGIHMVTVRSPNWRARALGMMQPVQVQTPGVEAWLMTKENAALLVDMLRKRTDYREHHSADVPIHNGQPSAISMKRPQAFMKSVRFQTASWPGYQLETGQVEEGFSFELSPLMSLDGATVDAIVKCDVDQVEKMVPVTVEVPNSQQGNQRVQIQVPQVVSWRLHERFRWPSGQVLLISAGIVATPGEGKTTTPFMIRNPFEFAPPRADGLIFVQCKGDASHALLPPARTAHAGAAGVGAPR